MKCRQVFEYGEDKIDDSPFPLKRPYILMGHPAVYEKWAYDYNKYTNDYFYSWQAVSVHSEQAIQVFVHYSRKEKWYDYRSHKEVALRET